MHLRFIRRHWQALVSQVALLAVAFALGWHSPAWTKRETAASPRPPAQTPATPLQPTTDKLAQAKAELAKILQTPAGNERERNLFALVDGLDARTIQGLLNDLAAHHDNSTSTFQLASILVTRFAELDPAAALDFLKVIRVHFPNMPSLSVTIFDVLSSKDPVAALAELSLLPAGAYRDLASIAVLKNAVDRDPQAALASLRNHPGSGSFLLSEYMFQEWAGNDPGGAAAAALSLSPSTLRGSALQAIAATWAKLDPTSAMSWANDLPPSQERISALSTVASAWAEQDPDAALTWAKGLPPGQEKDAADFSAIIAMSKTNPASAAAQILQLTGISNEHDIITNLAANWAQIDPAGLLTWADKNLTDDTYAFAVDDAINSMAQADPTAATRAFAQITDPNVIAKIAPELAGELANQNVQTAMQWAQSLPTDNPAARNAAFSSVLQLWTTSNPAGAANYLEQNLANDPSFNQLANQVVNDWSNADPQAAFAWAENLPAGDAQNGAVTNTLTKLAKVDPQTAWNDAVQLSGTNNGQAEMSVINAWSANQPAQAAAALGDIPAGDNLNAATSDVAKNWLNQNPTAAAQWINTLPQGTARDSAVTQLVSAIGKNDPASALTWAVSIGDSATRDTQAVSLLKQWANKNPAAAATAAQNTLSTLDGLTADQQTELQTIANPATTP